MNETCNTSTLGGCINTVKRLTNFERTMQDTAEMVDSYDYGSSMVKRAAEFLGKFLHWSTGTMDAETARHYDGKINTIQDELVKNQDLRHNQSLLIQKLVTINNHTNEHVKEYLVTLQNKMAIQDARIIALFQKIEDQTVIQDLTNMGEMLVTEYNRLADSIIETLRNAIAGSFPKLVPIHQVKTDLEKIVKLLKTNQALPIDMNKENVLHIFTTSKVSSTLYNGRVMMEVAIPIVESNTYKLFRSIPIPFLKDNAVYTIIPKSEFFLLDTHNSEVTPVDQHDLYVNTKASHSDIIVKPTKFIKQNKNKVCELVAMHSSNASLIKEQCNIRQIPKANYFVPLNGNNHIYVFLVTPMDITQICRNGELSLSRLMQSGCMHIPNDCEIRSDDDRIRTHNTQTFNNTKLVIPARDLFNPSEIKLKRSAVLLYSRPAVLINDNIQDFNDIAMEAQELINQDEVKLKLEDISYDSFMSSFWSGAIIVSVLGIVITVMGAFVCLRFGALSGIIEKITTILFNNHATESITIGQTHNNAQHHTVDTSSGIQQTLMTILGHNNIQQTNNHELASIQEIPLDAIGYQ